MCGVFGRSVVLFPRVLTNTMYHIKLEMYNLDQQAFNIVAFHDLQSVSDVLAGSLYERRGPLVTTFQGGGIVQRGGSTLSCLARNSPSYSGSLTPLTCLKSDTSMQIIHKGQYSSHIIVRTCDTNGQATHRSLTDRQMCNAREWVHDLTRLFRADKTCTPEGRPLANLQTPAYMDRSTMLGCDMRVHTMISNISRRRSLWPKSFPL